MKFLRLGLACGAHTDPHLQQLMCNVMDPRSVALFISSGGHLPELMALQLRVAEQGARVIAITASQSPLARKADAALVAEHNEHAATHLPMVSRVLHLLLVDILVTGVEMRRPHRDRSPLADLQATASADLPGVQMASPLRPFISHRQ